MPSSRRHIPPSAPAVMRGTEVPILPDSVTTEEILDMRFERKTSGLQRAHAIHFQLASDAKGSAESPPPQRSLRSDRTGGVVKANEFAQLDLEVDKFMAALMVTELPDAVIGTITASNDLQRCTKQTAGSEGTVSLTLAAHGIPLLGIGTLFG